MRVVALYSIKGGVGKTSVAVNLAALAAQSGLRTALWDLDPQAAATYLLRAKPKVKGGGDALISGKRALQDVVRSTEVPGLDIIPADFSYRDLDTALSDGKKPTRQVARLVKPLREHYDLLLLDCPPSISLLSENVFEAAELLVVPLIPTTLSLRTLDQLVDFLEVDGAKPPQIRSFFSMVDSRKTLHKQVVADLVGDPRMLPTAIPSASSIERMGLEQLPVVLSEPRSKVAVAFRRLWIDVQNALGDGVRR
ncbi:MAG: ParA family protein [Frankiales bacterium]|nr:ParA family protein [Frankiales bacterium]